MFFPSKRFFSSAMVNHFVASIKCKLKLLLPGVKWCLVSPSSRVNVPLFFHDTHVVS